MDKDFFSAQEPEKKTALYGVSQDTIRALEDALEAGDEVAVRHLLEPLHTADVAEVIEYLSPALRYTLIELLRPRFDPEILAHLDETVREEVIGQLGARATAQVLTNLESDEVVALIEDYLLSSYPTLQLSFV